MNMSINNKTKLWITTILDVLVGVLFKIIEQQKTRVLFISFIEIWSVDTMSLMLENWMRKNVSED